MKHLFFRIFILFLMFPALAAAGQLKVVTSLFPLYDFARQIGGEQVAVTMLLPPGVEAHGFSPTPRDMMSLDRADLFLYTGVAMEPWVADMLQGVDNKELHVVDTSVGLAKSCHHGDQQHHHHHGHDPHIWLDPIKAMAMAAKIGTALALVDPDHAAIFAQRTKSYIDQLKDLDKKIKKGLASCRLQTIISGGHFAFGHFSCRYGLQTASAYGGFSPDAKPSPRAIAQLIATMKRLGSKVVFHEELLEPKVARILAEETGATLLLLHGAHNLSARERAAGLSYIAIMEQNLSHLQQGLQCQ